MTKTMPAKKRITIYLAINVEAEGHDDVAAFTRKADARGYIKKQSHGDWIVMERPLNKSL